MRQKKKLLLFTIRNDIAIMYLKELKSVFDDYVDISFYSFENQNQQRFSKSIMKGIDVILVTSDNVYSLIRNSIEKNQRVIYLHFSFTKEKIDQLKSLPYDTNAYIGFKSYSASFITVSHLYELGINNLNLKVYDPHTVKPESIDVGIISDSSTIFPPEVSNILSIGKRKISFQSLLDIATLLNIINDDIENKIHTYCQDMPTIDKSLDYLQEKSQSTNIQMQTIINTIGDGFLMLDNNGKIINYNKQIQAMFNLKKGIRNQNVSEQLEFKELLTYFNSPLDVYNQLVNLKNMRIILTKQIIYSKENGQNIHICLIKNTTDIMKLENLLKKELQKKGHIAKYDFSYLIGTGEVIRNTVEKAKKIATIDKTTLIYGESGTGKEIFAQAIHNNSIRKNYPFIAINCATLPSTLLESELFGYIEGSFTGAHKGGHAGLFESAHMGTLFLDEIGEISLETQAKLLRVLEEKEIRRIGSNDVISVDVKIIAATNKNLRQQVELGQFRLDLYYRLNTVMLKIPPLRDRKDDLPELVNYYLSQEKKESLKISPSVWNFFNEYSWEGNVRELRNAIEYMAAISEKEITLESLPEYMLECQSMYPLETPKKSFTDEELSTKILVLIREKQMGRRSLVEALKIEKLSISEYKVRELLDYLKSQNFISFTAGRKGTQITKEGLKFLEEL